MASIVSIRKMMKVGNLGVLTDYQRKAASLKLYESADHTL